jgi:hypothetical protein
MEEASSRREYPASPLDKRTNAFSVPAERATSFFARNFGARCALSLADHWRERPAMPRGLKIFRSHIGFYDIIIAAPSMKAAAAAWGASPRIFQQGFAAETDERGAVKAALAEPGIVLRRPFGTNGPYKKQPEPIPAPKADPHRKKKAAKAEQARKRKAAAEKHAEAKAARQAKKDAENELSDIEREEARLRARRQALQKKFHLRSV